jgi:hypothetical protein
MALLLAQSTARQSAGEVFECAAAAAIRATNAESETMTSSSPTMIDMTPA